MEPCGAVVKLKHCSQTSANDTSSIPLALGGLSLQSSHAHWGVWAMCSELDTIFQVQSRQSKIQWFHDFP